jgi:hypothetical protein
VRGTERDFGAFNCVFAGEVEIPVSSSAPVLSLFPSVYKVNVEMGELTNDSLH